jgi:hypothetical protein
MKNFSRTRLHEVSYLGREGTMFWVLPHVVRRQPELSEECIAWIFRLFLLVFYLAYIPPCRWMWYVPSKRRVLSDLHWVENQKTVLYIASGSENLYITQFIFRSTVVSCRYAMACNTFVDELIPLCLLTKREYIERKKSLVSNEFYFSSCRFRNKYINSNLINLKQSYSTGNQ